VQKIAECSIHQLSATLTTTFTDSLENYPTLPYLTSTPPVYIYISRRVPHLAQFA